MFGEESSCVRAVACVVFRSPNITFASAPVLMSNCGITSYWTIRLEIENLNLHNSKRLRGESAGVHGLGNSYHAITSQSLVQFLLLLLLRRRLCL